VPSRSSRLNYIPVNLAMDLSGDFLIYGCRTLKISTVNNPDLVTHFIFHSLFFLFIRHIFDLSICCFYRFIYDLGNTIPARFKSRFEKGQYLFMTGRQRSTYKSRQANAPAAVLPPDAWSPVCKMGRGTHQNQLTV
jgi:hypothetical protein